MLNNNGFPGNTSPVINHNPSLSISLSIQSRNTILQIITKMLDNLQKVLLHYNKAFTFPIQSLTNTLNNYSLVQHQDITSSIFQSTLNHIESCLILQQKMWKDILSHKTTADSELASLQQNIRYLKHQTLVVINPMNTVHFIPSAIPIIPPLPTQKPSIFFLHHNVKNVNGQNTSSVHYDPSNMKTLKSVPYSSTVTPSVLEISSNSSNNSNKSTQSSRKSDHSHSAETQPEKKKRKRRGYNGPYSAEEKQFMIDFNGNSKCDATAHIIALSGEMEKKFKVKRSPYGLAQKMYQMNVINSRLKALFQRKFEDEDKERKVLDTEAVKIKPENVSNCIDSKDTDSVLSNDSYCSVKRRPFVLDEVQYIQELIKTHSNENPRKLFWRFIQRFTNWKNDSKSYQRFYHKYWTLINEQKQKKDDTVRGNNVKNDKKRPSDVAINDDCKRFKSSSNHDAVD